jgi:hypothetical protein
MPDFLPPQAPGGQEPAHWVPPPTRAPDSARVVVANRPDAPEAVRAADHGLRNGQAIAGFVLGLVGLGLLIVSVGLSFLVSLPLSVLAIVFGRQGRRRARREGIGGERRARLAVILGVLGCVLCVVAAVAWILVIVLNVDVGTDVGHDTPSQFGMALLTLRVG